MSGERWERRLNPMQERVARRFRYHVRTPKNPRGKILRPDFCPFCWPDEPTGRVEAHHPDYSKPFVVVWGCEGCHRRFEYGSIKIKPKDLWDYTSLVNAKPERWVENRPKPSQEEMDALPF